MQEGNALHQVHQHLAALRLVCCTVSAPCFMLHSQAKARLAAAKKKGDAKKKSALSSAALAEAQARKAKLSKQKDTKAYNQMPTR
jgi:hypothetical protein